MSVVADQRRSGDGFVGRRRELDRLRRWLDDARGSQGRLVVVAGEPGIGKTRLAQELAGVALAESCEVAWGRCAELEGAPAYWPWRQVLTSLGAEVDGVFAGGGEAVEDRFRLFDDVARVFASRSGERATLVIVDDVHWADEPSLLMLRHLAERLTDFTLLLVVTLRDVEPAEVLRRVLPDLSRAPRVERLNLRGFDADEIRQQLGEADVAAGEVLDVTGGNPLFVREVARAIADGTWHPDQPPHSVVDLVAARVGLLSADCRRFVQAAAIAGRYFRLGLVASATEVTIERGVELVDEATSYGLIAATGEPAEYRFVHALTRDAVEQSLGGTQRLALHEAVARAIEQNHRANLSEHLTELARHWLVLAPYGHGPTARGWAVRAAEDAVSRLAYEEGVRLYRAALQAAPETIDEDERARLQLALGRAAYLAGDLRGSVEASTLAAAAAQAVGNDVLFGEAALIVEPVPDPQINIVLTDMCEQAIDRLRNVDTGTSGLRARLLAQQSHLMYYAGQQERTRQLSDEALRVARAAADDRAIVDALRARQEALPGPAGREERLGLAGEMLAAASRTSNARSAMWGYLWRIEALAENGEFAAADEQLPALRAAGDRVGGPVAAWHCDRTAAGLAQAQARYTEAAELGRRAYERMRPIEAPPATGAYFALNVALAQHVAVAEDVLHLARNPFPAPPLFRTMGPLARANLLLCAGFPDEAAAAYMAAGPVRSWSLPPFFELPGYVYGALAAAELDRVDDLAVVVVHLERFRGEHAVGNAVAYLGPTELTLGRAHAALGQLDRAIDELTFAVERARDAGAPAFAAAGRYHLAHALLDRGADDSRDLARALLGESSRTVAALGMTQYVDRVTGLLAGLSTPDAASQLSPREAEIAQLVAGGLTNRQIADRLVISERTAQNHVQHILTKLGFNSRSQIAAWAARGG